MRDVVAHDHVTGTRVAPPRGEDELHVLKPIPGALTAEARTPSGGVRTARRGRRASDILPA